jgi:hypothetical protein
MHHAAIRNEAKERIIEREVAKLDRQQAAKRRREFRAAPTLTGWEVVDGEGRSLGFERETLASANGIAQSLNNAALDGPKALCRALGAGRLA